MKKLFWISVFVCLGQLALAQSAEVLLKKVTEKLSKVSDYEASGKMSTNVPFLKAPKANVTVYYKKPDQLRIRNEEGVSFIPKGTVNISLANLLIGIDDFDILDNGKQNPSGLRVVRLLPKNSRSDVVLSTLYIEESSALVRKVVSTTREDGTYELELDYGRYVEWGLPDRVLFSFNTREYKLPKGITFDYEAGKANNEKNRMEQDKGSIEIIYSRYMVNKGLPNDLFR